MKRRFRFGIVRHLFQKYQLSKAAVKLTIVRSEYFSLGNGLRQGVFLSPILLAVYLDPLLEEPRSCTVGCHVGGTRAGGLWLCCWCTVGGAQSLTSGTVTEMMDICGRYSVASNLTFNSSRCAVMTVPSARCCGVKLELGGKVISVKHLGHILST